MKTFLEYVAEDIISKYGTNFTRIAVVFPNKRAALFFNDYLARIAGKPIWSPSYITVSELFRRHSSMTVGDPIKLICDIHKSFTEETGIDETLDHFYGWGQLLLADFDDIDKNMADADKVFANLKDIHELDDISYLDDEQKDMLRKFFSNFSEEHNTVLKERFLKLWSRFSDIYTNFRQRLRSQNIAYEGMLYRDVATDESITFEYDTYLFIGFNVIQKVEQTLFTRLKEQGKAQFYWDFDNYYMRKANPGLATNEAGHYISQYLTRFPNELDTNNADIYDNFSNVAADYKSAETAETKAKDITYLSASTETIQAHYVSAWLLENDRYKAGRKTAIVLCDESLLQSVIHCIPSKVDKINITTGFPLANTPVASFTHQLLALQLNGYSPSSGCFRFKYVAQLLSHPYCQYIFPQHTALLAQLRKEGRAYIKRERFSDDVVAADCKSAETAETELFRPVADNAELLSWLLGVLKHVAVDSKDKDPLFQESVFRMYTLLNRMSGLVDCGDLDVDPITLQKLITQVIGTTSIPFHGEPAEGVQIMGVLETRNLDFDHVLMLSCNEGNMPKGVNDSSFIPYSIRKAYGLTTVDNKVAVYAYYFNRLLQRATDVSLAYNNSTEDGHTGEMSRFMLQLMVESRFDIKHKALQSGQNRLFNEPRPIKKDSRTMSKLDSIKRLSPTAINRYMRCQLQFYYNNVAGIMEPDDTDSDDIDNRVFGNIFHSASEKIYKRLLHVNTIITASAIDNVLKHREQIEFIVDETIRKEVFHLNASSDYKSAETKYNGLQLINREVIIRYLIRLLEIDRTLTPFRINMLEGDVEDSLELTVNGQSKQIKIGGRIDRVDQITDVSADVSADFKSAETKDFKSAETNSERIRIIDYKTGGAVFKNSMNSVEDIFATPVDPHKHADYYLQTMLYSVIVSGSDQHNPQHLPVSPALLFIQHTIEDHYDPVLKIGKDKIVDISLYADEFRRRLAAVVSEIFNPSVPFSPTDDTSACAMCPYATLCGI